MLVTRSNAGCVTLSPTLGAPDDASSFATYMPGFGKTAMFAMNSYAGYVQDSYIRAIYIKIGASVFGAKVNVSKLGLEEFHSKNLLSISPNPASDFIRIVPAGGNLSLVASLYNITGQLVRSIKVSENTTILKTSDIPAGLYFLKATDGREKQTFKVVIEH